MAHQYTALYLSTLLLVLVGCGPKPPRPPPPLVSVNTLQPQAVSIPYSYAGRIGAIREVAVRPQASGILLERTYHEGQMVYAGDCLFKIDPSSYQALADQADAQLSYATEQFERAQALIELKAISQAEFSQAKAQYLSAQAQAQVAHINLAYTNVTAPVTGIASKEFITPGNLVSQESSSILAMIQPLDPLYIHTAFPSQQVLEHPSLLTLDSLTFTVTLQDGSSHPQVATLDCTDKAIDPSTDSFKVRALITSPAHRLRPGQFVRLTLQGLTIPDALVIPARSVLQSEQGCAVYVLSEHNLPEIRPIELGPITAQGYIVTRGLAAGDTIITEGMIQVRPGQPIRTEQPASH